MMFTEIVNLLQAFQLLKGTAVSSMCSYTEIVVKFKFCM